MWLYLLLILCIILLIKFFVFDRDYWTKRNIVQVNGVLWRFVLSKRSLSEVYKQIYDEHPLESHIGVFPGHKPALILKDLDNIQSVLAGNFQNFYSRGIPVNPNDILADNVLFMEDYCRWKLMRQKLTPMFTSARLKTMFYIMERCARDFVIFIKNNEELKKNPFDILYTYTTASIGATVFGIDTQVKNTMDSPFLDMARKALAPTFVGNLKILINSMSIRVSVLLNLKTFGEYEDFFIGFVKKVLQNRKHDTNERNDFIDLCLDLQKQGILQDHTNSYELLPTDELLAAQAFFFFIAGTDTSANAFNFTLLELSNNPDILEKLHAEVDEIFNNCNEKVTFDDIEKLQYLDMVISEALRKYPPIGVIQRRCMNDTILPAGNVKIKKNELILVPIYAIHRDEKYYPNPEKFDPERFSPSNIANLTKYSYLPFGEGNRICIGARFARLQLKVAVAWFLRRFTLGPHSHTPERFEPSFFSLRASDVTYKILDREVYRYIE